MRATIPYMGGKQKLGRKIADLLPEARLYDERLKHWHRKSWATHIALSPWRSLRQDTLWLNC